MSMFKRMLATAGIGAAKVDMLIDAEAVQAGDTLTGVVRIQGGRVPQQVEDVYAFLKTRYIKEVNDRKEYVETVIAKFLLTGQFTVEAEQTYEYPFAFELPDITPVSIHKSSVWISTGLDIRDAVDPTDRDPLKVLPHPHAQVVLDAVDRLGFRLREATCDYAPGLGRGVPFIQEFEFVPTSRFRGQLDELEIIFFPDAWGVELLLQIDRKARGLFGLFSEASGTDESFVRVHFSSDELSAGADAMATELEALISHYV